MERICVYPGSFDPVTLVTRMLSAVPRSCSTA